MLVRIIDSLRPIRKPLAGAVKPRHMVQLYVQFLGCNLRRPFGIARKFLASVVRRVDNAIHRINLSPAKQCWQNKLHHPVDRVESEVE